MTEEDQEALERKLMKKYAEEALERKIKPRIPWNYNCSVKIMKFQVKKIHLSKKLRAKTVEKPTKQTMIENYVLNVKKKKENKIINPIL